LCPNQSRTIQNGKYQWQSTIVPAAILGLVWHAPPTGYQWNWLYELHGLDYKLTHRQGSASINLERPLINIISPPHTNHRAQTNHDNGPLLAISNTEALALVMLSLALPIGTAYQETQDSYNILKHKFGTHSCFTHTFNSLHPSHFPASFFIHFFNCIVVLSLCLKQAQRYKFFTEDDGTDE